MVHALLLYKINPNKDTYAMARRNLETNINIRLNLDDMNVLKKEAVMIDDGGEKINKKIKNPSIVNLINEYQNNGFTLEKVTSANG